MKRSANGGEKSGKKITERKKIHEAGGSQMKDDCG